jgi:hypothetical protein
LIAASKKTGAGVRPCRTPQWQHCYSFLEYIYFSLQKPQKSVDNVLAQRQLS